MSNAPNPMQVVVVEKTKLEKPGEYARELAPTARRAPHVVVVGTVRAPLSVVWKVFRSFGPDIMTWWPIYDWVTLDAPGVDEVGAVRTCRSNGLTYRERLLLRDDSAHILEWEMLESDFPLPIDSIVTTVRMRQANLLETEVGWSSEIRVNPLFLPAFKLAQRHAHYEAIESLARYFNPATEILELKIIDGYIPRTWGILPPNAYVDARLGDGPPQRTRVAPLSTRPKWNETLRFNVGVMDRQVQASIWNATLARDGLLGTATIELPDSLSANWTQQTVLLHGPNSGVITVGLRRTPEFQVLRETMSLAKTLGSAFGRVIRPLGQLGFEIGMLDTALASIEKTANHYLTQTLGTALHLPNGTSLVNDLGGTLLLDLKRAAGGVQNTIEGLADLVLALSQQVVESIKTGEQAVYGYDRYPRLPQIPDVPLEDLPRMVKGLPLQEMLPPQNLGAMLQRGLEYAYSEFQLVDRYKKALLEQKDPFEAFFSGWVTRPDAVVDHWTDDAELCRQLIQGLDPLVIKMVRSLDEIPISMLNLSAQGKSLKELIKEQRLFILDYVLLSELELYKDMVFYAPIVLVYRELLDGGASRLNLVGIQLTRNEGLNQVYTATGTPPNRYLYAKIQVACADNQYHQFISHLGIGHLAMEPFVIAHHNVFYTAKDHPIGKLLAPHLENTIGINYLARMTLVAPKGAFTDNTFAPGTAQALQLFLSAWEQYNFEQNAFPNELAARGFDEAGTDGVQDYYYRDDGFLIWRALETYVTEIVEAVYPNDGAVAADPVIQRWAFECSDRDRADIPGFPKAITARAHLVRTLVTIIFQASAFHSAVNFPQFDYLTYVPNRPDCTMAKMPDGVEDITREWIFLKGMPNFFVSNFQISFAVLLTTPPEATLSSITALSAEFPEIFSRFQKNLALIAQRIAERDRQLVAAGKQPYPYLSPNRIAASVAI